MNNTNYTPYLIGTAIGLFIGFMLWKRNASITASVSGLNKLSSVLNKPNMSMVGSIRNYGQSYAQDMATKGMMSRLMMNRPFPRR